MKNGGGQEEGRRGSKAKMFLKAGWKILNDDSSMSLLPISNKDMNTPYYLYSNINSTSLFFTIMFILALCAFDLLLPLITHFVLHMKRHALLPVKTQISNNLGQTYD